PYIGRMERGMADDTMDTLMAHWVERMDDLHRRKRLPDSLIAKRDPAVRLVPQPSPGPGTSSEPACVEQRKPQGFGWSMHDHHRRERPQRHVEGVNVVL